MFEEIRAGLIANVKVVVATSVAVLFASAIAASTILDKGPLNLRNVGLPGLNSCISSAHKDDTKGNDTDTCGSSILED